MNSTVVATDAFHLFRSNGLRAEVLARTSLEKRGSGKCPPNGVF